MQTQDTSNADGRTLRSERSRRKIVDALFELVGEGHLMPTAKQVAERADLGIRTVFRHFADMDTLFEEMHLRLRRDVIDATRIEIPDGTSRERLEALVALRCELFEKISPWWNATEAQRSRSAFLTEVHESDTPRLRNHLFNWLPEFRALPSAITDALEMVLSPEAWNRLRTEQKLSAKRATAATHRVALALCERVLD
ncbi:MAG: TetR/AcrR family transcriptional regulator [Myxococcota bacterium]|jgi:AcrR family transcriptional regulator|nr:TetR/AcrR family transcriptional regulator [Myxococcota bacterium]